MKKSTSNNNNDNINIHNHNNNNNTNNNKNNKKQKKQKRTIKHQRRYSKKQECRPTGVSLTQTKWGH